VSSAFAAGSREPSAKDASAGLFDMLAILAPAALFPGERSGRNMRIRPRGYMLIPLRSLVA
jgi:hypothetical protein